MQSLRWAVVPLLMTSSLALAAPRTHTVTLGAVRKVPYLPPEAMADAKGESILRVRPLLVDGLQREWTMGDAHEVTERTFVVQRVLHVNDALPGEPVRWVWEPGPWLQVDRTSGHIAALHLPAFDTEISEAVWYRDYAAYCGLTTGARGGMVAVVVELGARKAVAEKPLGKAPAERPACGRPLWQRMPMRVTFPAAAGTGPVILEVAGSSSLVEEDPADPE